MQIKLAAFALLVGVAAPSLAQSRSWRVQKIYIAPGGHNLGDTIGAHQPK